MAAILAIDDDPVNRLLLATVLTPLGHEVREAPDGSAGLDAIAVAEPDVVIVDLSMPGMGGAEFLKKLRRERQSTVRVVLSTATRTDAAMRDFAALYAVSAILEKPAEPAEIARVVTEVLAAPLRARTVE